jgi:hypothetical protein
MAANLEEVVVTARTFPNILALPVGGKIGDLEIQTTVETVHTDRVTKTKHPVERGSTVGDHAYMEPAEVILRCGWSNSSLKALLGIVTGFFAGGTMSRSDYVSGVYSQLLKLQQSLEPLTITTSLRQYDNMLITSLQVTRDPKTSNVLSVAATCEEIPIVSTSSTTLPPKESHADPASTAEVDDIGTQQATSATPAPGGSVPPNEW